MDNSNILLAFSLTLLAGLSTGIGSLMILLFKTKNYNYLSMLLGISAGVMICVSFLEILPEAISNLQNSYGTKIGLQFAILSFFCGMALSALIDRIVPNEKLYTKNISTNNLKLYRAGIISSIIIALHNFPEGIATFVTAIESPRLALPVTLAIAMHNIPEGITVAAPIYFSTKNKKKAFFYSFATGLSEPLGALLAYIAIARYMNEVIFGIIFGMVAGIMVFISFDELLPLAQEYGEHYVSIYGLILGMAIMSTSLVMFA